jgi:hypothetical protein
MGCLTTTGRCLRAAWFAAVKDNSKPFHAYQCLVVGCPGCSVVVSFRSSLCTSLLVLLGPWMMGTMASAHCRSAIRGFHGMLKERCASHEVFHSWLGSLGACEPDDCTVLALAEHMEGCWYQRMSGEWSAAAGLSCLVAGGVVLGCWRCFMHAWFARISPVRGLL